MLSWKKEKKRKEKKGIKSIWIKTFKFYQPSSISLTSRWKFAWLTEMVFTNAREYSKQVFRKFSIKAKEKQV